MGDTSTETDDEHVNEAEFTVGDLKEVAQEAAQEAIEGDERLRTQTEDEIRAIARNVADEVVAERMVDGYERAQKKWDNMSSAERARKMGDAFSGHSRKRQKVQRLRGNTFVRSLRFILRSQLDKGHNQWTWQDVAERAEQGIEDTKSDRVHQDEKVASVVKSSLQAGDMSGAGSLIPSEMADDFIEFLRSTTVLGEMGARTITLENGSIDFGKQTSTVDHYWVGEGYEVGDSTPGFGNVKLDLRKLGIIVKMTNEALQRVPQGLEQLVEDDARAVGEEAIDITGIRSEGGGARPAGIRKMMSDDNQVASQGDSTTEVVEDLARLIYLVSGSDIPMNSPGWILSERTRTWLLQLQDGNDNLVSFAEMVADDQLFGFPLFSTSQIPTDLNASGNNNDDETEIYFGDASQLIIGEGTEVRAKSFDAGTVGQDNLVTDDLQALRVIMMVDFALRHPEAFGMLEEFRADRQFDA